MGSLGIYSVPLLMSVFAGGALIGLIVVGPLWIRWRRKD